MRTLNPPWRPSCRCSRGTQSTSPRRTRPGAGGEPPPPPPHWPAPRRPVPPAAPARRRPHPAGRQAGGGAGGGGRAGGKAQVKSRGERAATQGATPACRESVITPCRHPPPLLPLPQHTERTLSAACPPPTRACRKSRCCAPPCSACLAPSTTMNSRALAAAGEGQSIAGTAWAMSSRMTRREGEQSRQCGDGDGSSAAGAAAAGGTRT